MKHQLNIIIGSTRPGRAGPVFAKWLEAFARKHGKFEPVLTDIAAFNLPVLDEPHHPKLGNYQNDHTKAWSKAIDAADAFVFVAPEYNYFAAPAIINAIDYPHASGNTNPPPSSAMVASPAACARRKRSSRC